MCYRLTDYFRDKVTVEKGEGFLYLFLTLVCFADTVLGCLLFCVVRGETTDLT